MLVDAVGEINVTLAFEASVRRKFRRMLAQRLVHVSDIVAANENIFTASDEMNRNVHQIEPRQVVRGHRGLVHCHILSGRAVIKAAELRRDKGTCSNKHKNIKQRTFVTGKVSGEKKTERRESTCFVL